MLTNNIRTSFKLFIMILTLFAITTALDTDQTPSTFALATVTHTRGEDNSQFMKYLNKYATMDCPIITEINIVWNNQKSMDELGVYQHKDKWKRPVYFYRTPHNSMNWRYKIAEESKAQVFFSIDDDITVDCQELKRGFEVWRKNAIGSIGPIVSYGPRYFEYTHDGGFAYGKKPTKNMFNIGLVGLAFISRHFMQLYYTDTFQIKQMQAYIVEKNNCDDIGLNWMVQYFYPELNTITLQGNIQNISPRIAQATRGDHYPFRTQCIQKFTEIFGQSLKYFPLNDNYKNKEKRSMPMSREIVMAKKEYLDNFVIKKSGKKNVEKIVDEFKEAIEVAKNVTASVEKVVQKQNEQTQKNTTSVIRDHSDVPLYQQIQKLKKDLQQSRKDLYDLRIQLHQQQTQLQQKSSEQDSFLFSEWRAYFEIFLIFVILCLLCQLINLHRQRHHIPYSSKISSYQVQIQS